MKQQKKQDRERKKAETDALSREERTDMYRKAYLHNKQSNSGSR